MSRHVRRLCCLLAFSISNILRMEASLLQLDIITYNSSIDVCGENSEWRISLLLLDDAAHRKLQPDAITYNTAISSSFDIVLAHGTPAEAQKGVA